ncbi:hypothetical protein DFH09DRAFT_1091724 [Mycena vulgaris]|nr:hypothetical protein DFH09DRAFT_1091724 [Mycena vulgaris]
MRREARSQDALAHCWVDWRACMWGAAALECVDERSSGWYLFTLLGIQRPRGDCGAKFGNGKASFKLIFSRRPPLFDAQPKFPAAVNPRYSRAARWNALDLDGWIGPRPLATRPSRMVGRAGSRGSAPRSASSRLVKDVRPRRRIHLSALQASKRPHAHSRPPRPTILPIAPPSTYTRPSLHTNSRTRKRRGAPPAHRVCSLALPPPQKALLAPHPVRARAPSRRGRACTPTRPLEAHRTTPPSLAPRARIPSLSIPDQPCARIPPPSEAQRTSARAGEKLALGVHPALGASRPRPDTTASATRSSAAPSLPALAALPRLRALAPPVLDVRISRTPHLAHFAFRIPQWRARPAKVNLGELMAGKLISQVQVQGKCKFSELNCCFPRDVRSTPPPQQGPRKYLPNTDGPSDIHCWMDEHRVMDPPGYYPQQQVQPPQRSNLERSPLLALETSKPTRVGRLERERKEAAEGDETDAPNDSAHLGGVEHPGLRRIEIYLLQRPIGALCANTTRTWMFGANLAVIDGIAAI